MQKEKTKIEYDLVLVGGSPSNLTLAHRIVDQIKAKSAESPAYFPKGKPGEPLSIAIIEKGEDFGAHIVSGAVVNKTIFDKVYPNHFEDGMPIETVCDKSYFSMMSPSKKWDVPAFISRLAVPDFHKEGYYILTLSLVVQWMAEQLKEKVKDVPNLVVDFFPGFPATEVLFDETEECKVTGVKVARTGDPLDDNVYGKVVCFGDKGFVSKDVLKKFNLQKNPQIWSVGVKETWKLPADYEHLEELLDTKAVNGKSPLEGKVWHTLGYPTLDGTLGGGFIYGLGHNRVTLGLVISLDSKNPNIHPQKQLQEYKKHPFVQELLKGGELLNYGAAVLPEGGFESLPEKFQVSGALLLGDSLGLLDVKSLAGVDKAIESGYIAADVLLDAFAANDFSEEKLSSYQRRLLDSPFMDKFKDNRYFRYTFQENPDLLGSYLPMVLDGIEKFGPEAKQRAAGSNSKALTAAAVGALGLGFKHPFKAITASLRANALLNNAKDFKEAVTYMEGYKHIDPDFSKELIERNQATEDLSYDKSTIYSREDAVFYAQTKYTYHPDHIDEFNADTCLKCISKYESRKLDVPCVSDCTAEVHRLDINKDEGIKVHAMSLENCVQCRTCELVCPEQNLRVNAAYAGSGPDFRGL